MIPDVSGFTFKEACIILTQSGLIIGEVLITAPPREKDLELKEDFRVVRTNLKDGNVVDLLLVKPL